MDLLLFYLSQIFSEGHFPSSSEICSGADSIESMCYATINFTLFFTSLVIIITSLLLFKNLCNKWALISFAVLDIVACFVLSDSAMKQIEAPEKYGVEWFMLSYYLWCLFLFNALISTFLFPLKRKFVVALTAIVTVLFILLFSYTGRGNFEQITPIAGGLFAKFGFDMLRLSFSFQFFCFLALFTFVSTSIWLVKNWVVTGEYSGAHVKTSLKNLGIFFIVLVSPVVSIPLGELFNKQDVAEAKNYIDDIKKKVVKYYYENGEYPKFVEGMLPERKNPRLLERHEFFTMGVRGTYYFSRADKFCFIFQNPTKDFGYYSITSERDWRHNLKSDSYDDSFVNLCDESEKNFEDLISGHLGVNPEDQLINEMSLEAGAPVVMPSMSKRSSKVLSDEILEQGKKDPSILKYYNPPSDQKDQ